MKIKNVVLKGIAKVAMKTAEQSANTDCFGPCYQPKRPESLKKLKKNV